MIIIHSIYNTYKPSYLSHIAGFLSSSSFLHDIPFSGYLAIRTICSPVAFCGLLHVGFIATYRTKRGTYLLILCTVCHSKSFGLGFSKKKKIKISEKIRESLLSVKLSSI